MKHKALRYILHDVSTNTAATVLRCISRMIVIVVLARSFSVEWFGVFTIMVGIETLLVCVVSALCTSSTPLIASGRSARVRAAVMRAGDRMQLYLTGLCVLIASPFLLLLDIEHTLIMIAFPCSIIATSAMNARRTDSTASFKSGRLLLAEIFIAIGCVGAILLPINEPELCLSVYWIAQSITMIIASVVIDPNRDFRRVPHRLSRAARGMILRKGVDMLSGSIALSAQNRIQPILVALVLGPIGAGMYGAISMFGAPLRLMCVSIRSVYLPRVSKRLRGSSPVSLLSMDPVLLGVGVVGLTVLSACTIFIASPMIGLVLGDEYVASAGALPVAVMAAGLGLITTPMVSEIQAMGKINITARYRWLAAIISLSSIVPLMNMMGVAGVFASIVIGEITMIIALCQAVWVRGLDSKSAELLHRRLMREVRKRAQSALLFTTKAKHTHITQTNS